MKFESKYNFGDILYLKHDADQLPWMVTEIEFRPGVTVYHMGCGEKRIAAYEFEVTEEINLISKLNIG